MQNVAFTGEIPNPIIDARIAIGLSANQLAKKLGLSRQYLQKVEAGTYTSINPQLLKWTANAQSISVGSVMKRYKHFQKVKRAATVEQIAPHKLARQNSSEPGYLIFERWRNGYWPSVVAFSNAFCIHTETVKNYEEGNREEMPLLMQEILSDAGLLDRETWKERVTHA